MRLPLDQGAHECRRRFPAFLVKLWRVQPFEAGGPHALNPDRVAGAHMGHQADQLGLGKRCTLPMSTQRRQQHQAGKVPPLSHRRSGRAALLRTVAA